MNVVLKLLGIYRDRAGQIVALRPSYHSEVPLWLVLLIAVALVGATYWLYRRTASYISPARRFTLTALRAGFLLLLLALVLHPVISVTVAGAVRQTLLVLVDTSGSMGVAEARTDDADIKRAAIARGDLQFDGGLTQTLKSPSVPKMPRIEVVKAAFKNPGLDLVRRLEDNYDLAPFTFDQSVTDVALAKPALAQESSTGQVGWSFAIVVALLAILGGAAMAAFLKPRTIGISVSAVGLLVFAGALIALMLSAPRRDLSPAKADDPSDRLHWVATLPKADGHATAIGDALRDAIYRKRGQALAGIVLVTDGVSNAGSSPMKAAELAHSENLPLYIYGVGVTSPRDIIVRDIFVPDVTFVRDEVPVTVHVQAQGLKGQTGRLVLKLGDHQVDDRELSFDETDQTVNLKCVPSDVGEFDLTASIEPRADEVSRDNNSTTRHIRVVDGRIKVLHIEQLPRWEFKYLEAMLLRDRRVEYKCHLLEADPGVFDSPKSPYIKTLPTRVADFAAYDLVILGDVDPKRLPPRFMEALNEYVSRAGGSVLMIAGRKFAPLAYAKSPIENMLPVEFDAVTPEMSRLPASDRPLRVELTERGKAATMLRLADKETDSLQRWAQLPALYWDARVARPKPAADVLLVDSDPAKASRYGKMPIIALQQYGLGQVLYVGTDNTWRFRRNQGEQDFTRLWSQMIERMALPHMLGASKRTQLSTDRQAYATGDRVQVFARLYREKDFEPITDPVVKGTFALKDAPGSAVEVMLRAMPDQPGMYRTEFVAGQPGAYRLRVETDAATSLDFVVNNQTAELTDMAMNESALRAMATQTNGQFYREETLYTLPDEVAKTTQPRLSSFEVEFAFSPLYFMLLLGVVTTEWILRKRCQLK